MCYTIQACNKKYNTPPAPFLHLQENETYRKAKAGFFLGGGGQKELCNTMV